MSPSWLLPGRADDGFTLIELIVAATMMVIVTGAVVSLMVSALNRQPEVTERANQIGTARNAIERLTADLRQGSEADWVSPAQLTVETFCDPPSGGGAVPCVIAYSCGEEPGGTWGCSRAVDGGAPNRLVSGLASPEVFCVVPSTGGSECGPSDGSEPAYVGVKIELPAGEQEGRTVLEGGAALHNAPSFQEG